MAECEWCSECFLRPVDRQGLCFGCRMKTVSFGGMRRLKSEREAGVTQREMGREITDEAKRTGRQIQRAGRCWT